MSSMSTSSTIAMRAATTDSDARIVHKLAVLDSAADPAGPVVIALVDGRPVAAASLTDGAVVADPFEPTADVVELLQARVAGSIRTAAARPRRRLRLVLPRLRPAA
jgi:predicted LPLAT superfamily acyltransferase